MVKVLGWMPVVGRPLPNPEIEDDSDRFPIEAVKHVREWLAKSKPQFEDAGPTPTTIQLTNDPFVPWFVISTVGYGVKEDVVFKHATIELLLRDKKTQVVVAKYRYLVARTADNRFDILGPQLKIEQLQPV